MSENYDLTASTATIVGSYVSHNALSAHDLPGVIASVHAALSTLGQAAVQAAPLVPAVSIRRAVTHDRVVCLDCGKGYKSLKRHLRTEHDLDPRAYRARWSLPADFPMVAPAYAAARSVLAKAIGLGQGGRHGAKPTAQPAKARVAKTAARPRVAAKPRAKAKPA
jgi:predicted transcriptional regulator